MKRLMIPAIIAAAAFTACGNRDRDPAEYVIADNFVIYEPASYAQAEMSAAPTATEPEAAGTPKLSYALNGTNVELTIDGEIIRTLEYYYTPEVSAIAVADYDFDGYDDIYIPYEYPTDYGYYYCYDPLKKTFKENAELAEIGRFMTVTGENTLTQSQSNQYGEQSIDYQWQGAKLKPVRRTESYKTADDKVHTNIYRYDSSGNEYLDETR